MPRNKSEKHPHRKDLLAYARALQAHLRDPLGSGVSLIKVWLELPYSERERMLYMRLPARVDLIFSSMGVHPGAVK